MKLGFNKPGVPMNVYTIDDFLRLPYTIEVIRDESDGLPGYVARVVELPGCLTQADDFQELGEMIEDAMRAWIETALEDGQTIPEPWPIEAYSGKFVVRVPRSLHRQLVVAAESDGVSLNSFVNVALARVIGLETVVPVPSRRGAKRQSQVEYTSSARYAQITETQGSDDQA